MPRFKIIIIKPGRRSREPKILLWVLASWQMPGWGCLVAMSSVGHGWLCLELCCD